MVSEKPVPPLDEAEVRACLAGFVGSITQVPPVYSAIKVGGRKLYERARRQEEVEAAGKTGPHPSARASRLRAGDDQRRGRLLRRDLYSQPGARHWARHRLRCSSLGPAPHPCGQLRSHACVPLSALPNWGSQMIIPLAELLPEVPRLDLAEATAERVRHGNAFPFAADPGLFRLFEGDRLIAIAEGGRQRDPAGSGAGSGQLSRRTAGCGQA